jgi:hypothetical protein
MKIYESRIWSPFGEEAVRPLIIQRFLQNQPSLQIVARANIITEYREA